MHQKVGLSGYGFSFDDDVADVGAGGATAFEIIDAPGATDYPQTKEWYPSTPWASLTADAMISQDGGNTILTFADDAAGVAAFWQLKADDAAGGVTGAYISTTKAGINIPAGTNLRSSLIRQP